LPWSKFPSNGGCAFVTAQFIAIIPPLIEYMLLDSRLIFCTSCIYCWCLKRYEWENEKIENYSIENINKMLF
jgi:hypothetical protein